MLIVFAIKSVHCSSGFMLLSNISLKVLIILSANTEWPLDVMYDVLFREILLKKPVFYSTLAVCHCNFWWAAHLVHELNEA